MAEGNPTPLITWYKRDNNISSGQLGNSSLEVHPERDGDFGIYKCKGTNILGSTNTYFNITRWGRYQLVSIKYLAYYKFSLVMIFIIDYYD